MLDLLIVVPVTKSSAMQRAGRAGRQQQGKCFRLYTNYTLDTLADYMPPEILRANLSSVILQMKAIGIQDIEKFDFLDKPKPEVIKNSLSSLKLLGTINEYEKLTQHGKEMAELPLDPIFSNLLLNSLAMNCAGDIISIISILSVENLFYFPQDQRQNLLKILQRFKIGNSDHLTKLNIINNYIEAKNKKSFCKENYLNKKTILKCLQVREQLQQYAEQILKKRLLRQQKQQQQQQNNQQNGQSTNENQQQKINTHLKFNTTEIQDSLVIKCLTKCMITKIAKINIDGSYTILKTNKKAQIHPESLVFYQKPKPEYIVFNEVVFTSKTYLRDVTEISYSDIKKN